MTTKISTIRDPLIVCLGFDKFQALYNLTVKMLTENLGYYPSNLQETILLKSSILSVLEMQYVNVYHHIDTGKIFSTMLDSIPKVSDTACIRIAALALYGCESTDAFIELFKSTPKPEDCVELLEKTVHNFCSSL